MTLEAVALHHLDNLDAKMHRFDQQMRDDPNVESPWTSFNHSLGRKAVQGQMPEPRRGQAAQQPWIDLRAQDRE